MRWLTSCLCRRLCSVRNISLSGPTSSHLTKIDQQNANVTAANEDIPVMFVYVGDALTMCVGDHVPEVQYGEYVGTCLETSPQNCNAREVYIDLRHNNS